MQQKLDKIIQYGLYTLAFLMPFFFLPYTRIPVFAHKQFLVAILGGLLLLLWITKIIVTGKAVFRWSRISTVVLVLLSVVGVSTLLSVSKQQGLWGMAFEADTFFSFILYGLVFLLFSNLIENKKQVLGTIKAILAGGGVLAVLFLLTVLFGNIFPWDFIKSAGNNPGGTNWALSMMLGVILILSVVLSSEGLKNLRKENKVNFVSIAIIGALSLVCVFLINYWASWVVIGLGCILMLWARGFKKESAIPACLLILTLIFIALFPTTKLVNLPGETVLSYQASLNIAKETLFQNIRQFLVGSGPATFVQSYDFFRPLGINTTPFWQSRFFQGPAVLLTLLTTTGMLGFVSLIFLMFSFFYSGLKSIFKTNNSKKKNSFSSNDLAVFVGGFCFLVLWFFYSINFSLMFFGFLMLGLWVASSVSGVKTYKFKLKKMQPQHSFFIMLACMLLIIGVIAGVYGAGRNYVGAFVFSKAVNTIKSEEQGIEVNIDKGILTLNRAVLITENDRYSRNLSQVFLLKLRQANSMDIEPELRKEILQSIISKIEKAMDSAIKINSANSQNWVNSGDIYGELAQIGVSNATVSSLRAYEKAQELSPRDPMILFKLASANLLLYQTFGSQEYLQTAANGFFNALKLKPNFTEAREILESL